MRIIDGSVVVRPMRDNDEIILKSGHRLYVPLEYSKSDAPPTKHECVVGVVLEVPERVLWGDWEDSSIQVEVGDTVIYHFISSRRKENFGDGIRVPYPSIFVVIRGGEVIPINGWILCEPIEEEIKSILHIPKVGKKKYTQRVRVAYVSVPTRRYTAARDGVEYYVRDSEYPELRCGDEVFVERNSDVNLEGDLEQILGRHYFRIQRRQILAYVT